ncbi:MAG: PAS domain-containing protein, partial [Myxococcota bacterium]
MSTVRAELEPDERLHELLAFLALVTDPLPDTVSYWDADARCRFANRAFEPWFGLVPEKMIGHPIRVLLGEELYARAEPHVLGALRGELQRFERIVHKVGGKSCHILGHYVPHVVRGEVVGFVALATDQSDQRKAEEDLRELMQTLEQRVSDRTAELRQSEERFRQVFEGAPLAVLTIDPSGRVGLYNPAAARLFGAGRTGEP